MQISSAYLILINVYVKMDKENKNNTTQVRNEVKQAM